MGDRANIVVYDPTADAHPREAVFLYTHWSGYDLPDTLKQALERGAERWNDGPYLARIIFEAMVSRDHGSLTGYGISTRITDNSYPLLVVDVPRGVVVEYPEDAYEADGFAKLGDYKGARFAEYKGEWTEEAEEDA